MNINPSEIKIKTKLLKSDTILAQASVIFFDVIETHGWKVLRSNNIHEIFNEEVWIQPPSYKTGSVWKEVVFLNDRELFDMVQMKIFDSYKFEQEKEAALGTNSGTEKGGVKSVKSGLEKGGIEITEEDLEKLNLMEF